jgi:hypothetical protein
VKRKHPDDDPEIPDWDDKNSYRELWALDDALRERPKSTSRVQGMEEAWD